MAAQRIAKHGCLYRAASLCDQNTGYLWRQVEPLISHTLPLTEFPAALQAFAYEITHHRKDQSSDLERGQER